MIRFEDVEKKVDRYHPELAGSSGEGLGLLRRAYIYSAKEHKDQVRASGEPYLIHPLSVAEILADMKLDVPSVCTGLLHDVVEDTLVTLNDIRVHFGDEIAHLVDGVTKISNLGKVSKEEAQAENLRKMVLAMVDDIRVVLVKLADRLHNMRTLQYLKPEKRNRISQETLEVYAPIAHRLGMSKIRMELEDLAFQYLYPDDYHRLKEEVEIRRASTEAFLDDVKARIAKRLIKEGVPFVRIEGRIKRLYSLHLKLKRQKIPLDKVYDLAAIRIITKDLKDCYFALGVMHKYWRPFQDRIKDFIANPRENGYQSLHTSVIGEEGHHFEVQIRTEEMHKIAEEGIAAHWKYKEGRAADDSSEVETMKWLRRLVEGQQDNSDARDFIDSFKLDLYPKEVYAFTPKGKVIQLPRNATPVDFAYAIHSQVGDQCTGAKVNGRIVPLKYEIENGDVIDIMTAPGHKPSRDWLNFAVTARARNKIKHWIALKQREESIDIGRKLLDREAIKYKVKIKTVIDGIQSQKFLSDNGFSRIDDMYAALGYGKMTARSVLARLIPENKIAEMPPPSSTRIQQVTSVVKRALRFNNDGIVIHGLSDALTYRAPCCNPIKGEDVIGYITRGKGVGVHAKRCKNVANLLINRERIIDVTWIGDNMGEPYPVRISVLTEDRQGQLAALTNVIAGIKTNIRDARTDDSVFKDGTRKIDLTVDITDIKHLDKVIAALKHVQGVIEAEHITEV